jgi:hypothetical protein
MLVVMASPRAEVVSMTSTVRFFGWPIVGSQSGLQMT